MALLNEERALDFEAVRLKLASPDAITHWSHGEVTKPETINYRTQKPERDGLFDERIFGPVKDWECYCGKYRRIRYKGIVCDKCGVEVTRSIVRRERMGHIKLASPVAHIWFLRGIPSKVGLLLDINVQQLEKVVYFASYIITSVDDDGKKETGERLEKELQEKTKEVQAIFRQGQDKIRQVAAEQGKDADNAKRKDIEKQLAQQLSKSDADRDEELKKLETAARTARGELQLLQSLQIISEVEYRSLSLKYGHLFTAGIGAEVLRSICEGLDLGKLARQLEGELKDAGAAKRKRIIRRLSLVRSFLKAKVRPEWMLLTAIPVIPPDLRPMVQLDGGRFAASDLNDLYRRVINRNNRLKRLLEMGAPEVITRNEKRMLQEAVDALIDNSARRGSTTTAAGQRRQLKSLADMLKGKQGRFRQNLLGKRVDYSGRSVIVIGPHLRLHQCGLPKKMALELFKPFVIHVLIERGLAHNIRSASRLIEQGIPEVWDALEDVTRAHKVLLNRAPTLHRLGIQAFQPVLIEGKAIQIHPMVCTPFNADFDGDQMAVHVPLSGPSRREAEEIMLSAKNLLKPSDGEPVTSASQDVVLGLYYATRMQDGATGTVRAFSSPTEAIFAYDAGSLAAHAKINVRMDSGAMQETTVGRILFNEILPRGTAFVNEDLDKKRLKAILGEVLSQHGLEETANFIDRMKDLGFRFATQSGISWGMDDLRVPDGKRAILERAEKEVDVVRQQFEQGLLTDEERYVKTVEIWEGAKNAVTDLVQKTLDRKGSVHAMVVSGARGSVGQVTQMMGMKGLVISPTGRTNELPIKSSFKEGFNVLEYFISTHGTRKGMADTALRTATAGYLTRRLVNVAQDVVVRQTGCGDTEGRLVTKKHSLEMGTTLSRRIRGRVLAKPVSHPQTGEVLYETGTLLGKEHAKRVEDAGVEEVTIRSVLTCKTLRGVCQQCYGWDLGSNTLVKLGEAVGIVAAQSIGEPGTQLTMRTFHLGGVAGGADITQGLPRVEELFEARPPKREAIVAEIGGTVKLLEREGQTVISLLSQEAGREAYLRAGIILDEHITDGAEVQPNQRLFMDVEGEEVFSKRKGIVKLTEKELAIEGTEADQREYAVPPEMAVAVKDGDIVRTGQQLTEGHVNVQHLYGVAGVEEVQRYVIREVQDVYAIQGEMINDKHLEIIVRQMFSRVRAKDGGGTSLLPGRVYEYAEFMEENERAAAEQKEPAIGERLLLGITKVSLTTASFLAAASFQETARVLIDAAVTGREDRLSGLKENVIIGKLIPVGTAYQTSRTVEANEK
jgi:DNA-directed RNA polymerase subunit beta'